MDYSEFLQNIKEAGLSVTDLARILRRHRNSISNYSHLGGVPSHLAVISVLMRELARNDLPFADLLAQLDLKPKAARGKPRRNN
jgi:hypothetical protein